MPLLRSLLPNMSTSCMCPCSWSLLRRMYLSRTCGQGPGFLLLVLFGEGPSVSNSASSGSSGDEGFSISRLMNAVPDSAPL
ncbi:hypothetical protein ZOSMA_155G00280 [Zostera marina]|uniref:Uncharacterized protein n=1 Tax=Zostera marina TaxID=29655 RepID=A0A0K9PXS4_ZOSMR|nr:hypothetical protein ZOSMA_155G00280 [Zostera marina]